jgi:hypothetical protein
MLIRTSAAALIGVLSLIAFSPYRPAYSTPFDECVVQEMRGQSVFMEPNVRKLCAERVGLEFDVTNSGITFEWTIDVNETTHPTTIPNPIYRVTLKARPNNTEWVVTKAALKYAYRPCDAPPPLKPNEFSVTGVIKI